MTISVEFHAIMGRACDLGEFEKGTESKKGHFISDTVNTIGIPMPEYWIYSIYIMERKTAITTLWVEFLLKITIHIFFLYKPWS